MKMFVDEMLKMSIEGDETITPETDQVVEVYSDDYEKLKNLPRLNGKEIIGDMVEVDPTVPAWAKEDNKPNYTAEEVSAVPANAVITFADIDEMFKMVFDS